MKNLSRIIWGLVLIVLGLIIALNALEITSINIFFKGWWTLFIIVPCAIGLFDEEEKTGNLIGLFIGVLLLLGAQDLISFKLVGKLIIPIILVCLGVMLIFNETIKSRISNKVKETKKSDMEDIIATFAEQKVDKSGEDFKSANLDAVFGGITLDLRKAKIKKEATIKASSIFGAITILVPKDVTVKVKATPVFGGVSNKSTKNDENKNVLYIDAFCMFGGVDIK